MPDAASDPQGELYVAWDSYQNGNYSVQYGNRRVVVGNGSSDDAKCYGARGYSVCVSKRFFMTPLWTRMAVVLRRKSKKTLMSKFTRDVMLRGRAERNEL